MIDVIAFLINNFQDFDTCPPSEDLGSLLEQVGFQDEEIRDTLLFMNVLQERSRSLHRNFREEQAMRVYLPLCRPRLWVCCTFWCKTARSLWNNGNLCCWR